MATKIIRGLGLTFDIEESELESGFAVLDQLQTEKTTPFECIQRIAKDFGYTPGKSTAVYAAWAGKHKPIF